MNIKVPTTHSLTTDQAWVDLSTIFAQPVSRNAYAAMLIQACVWTLLNYPLTGATKFALNWQEFDIIYGHTVTLTMPDRTVQGIAYGIDEHGALCLQINQEKRYFTNGEVSVRLATT
jgi:BirA family biotin operon repressor/biotin-[acetyl-CoA-carboxylase] ligase